jgi:hypothetical protein
MLRLLLVLLLTLAAVLPSRPAAGEEILLRTDCAGRANCFETLDEVLADLGGRPGNGGTPPGPTHPVAVDIGAGVFSLADTTYPYCDGVSHLSFRGAGKDATILTGGGYPSPGDGFFDLFGPYAVLIRDCSHLDFSHLTIQTQPGVSDAGIRFTGTGSTFWYSVRILVDNPNPASTPVAYLDGPGDGAHPQTHHWTDVQATIKRTAGPAYGFWISGSRHEFRASHVNLSTAGGIIYGAIYGTGSFDLHVQGSLVEVADSATGGSGDVIALWFTTGGFLYPNCDLGRATIEGSRIRASSVRSGGNTRAIGNFCASQPGAIKARGDQFDVTGNNTLIRVSGVVDSPYDLGSGANPPTLSSVWSGRGADRFVETDCGATCQNTAQGSELHELLFDPNCTAAGRWFDTATRKCRGL